MSIVQITEAISLYVNQVIENSQLAPLEQGRILLGREYVIDDAVPNRIVFVPTRTRFGPPQVTSTTDNVALGGGRLARVRARTLASRLITFEVHVWGAAKPNAAYTDYDVTEALSEIVVAVSYLMASSDAKWGDGVWVDQQENEMQRERLGHYFVFPLSFDGAVVDQAVNVAPPGTSLRPRININVQIG